MSRMAVHYNKHVGYIKQVITSCGIENEEGFGHIQWIATMIPADVTCDWCIIKMGKEVEDKSKNPFDLDDPEFRKKFKALLQEFSHDSDEGDRTWYKELFNEILDEWKPSSVPTSTNLKPLSSRRLEVAKAALDEIESRIKAGRCTTDEIVSFLRWMG